MAGLPVADRGITDPVLAAQVGHRNPSLVCLQNSDDLPFREAATLHVPVLSTGQNKLQSELESGGDGRPIAAPFRSDQRSAFGGWRRVTYAMSEHEGNGTGVSNAGVERQDGAEGDLAASAMRDIHRRVGCQRDDDRMRG